MGIAGATVAVVAAPPRSSSPPRCSPSGARSCARGAAPARRGGPLAPARPRRDAPPGHGRAHHRRRHARRRRAGADHGVVGDRRLGDPGGQERARRRRRAGGRRRHRPRARGRRRRRARPAADASRPSPPEPPPSPASSRSRRPAPWTRPPGSSTSRRQATPPARPRRRSCASCARSPPPSTCGSAGAPPSSSTSRQAIGSRLLLAIALLVGLTLIVLWLMTGSVVLPVKAVLMNALTVGAALAPLTIIYQGGHLTGLLGYTPNGGVEPSDFLVTAAIVFALSTDYGVFLLGRIKEERDRGAGEREAVALRPRPHGAGRDRRGDPARRRDRRVQHELDLVHPADRRRDRGRRADRRVRRADVARALAHGAARPLELVVAASAAPPARADRAARGLACARARSCAACSPVSAATRRSSPGRRWCSCRRC